MNAYEARQQARRERLKKAAEKAKAESSSAFAAADQISKRFEGGQPILQGHHSENGARRDQDRIDRGMRRGIEASTRAHDLSARAAAVGGAGISSDDPDAIAKLREREAELALELERVKVLRKAMRGWEPAPYGAPNEQVAPILADLRRRCESVHATTEEVRMMASCLAAGQDAVPAYAVSSPRENIRRIQERIAQLEAKVGAVYPEPILGDGYRIECNADENRVTVRFTNRVETATINALKSSGFKWSGSARDWRRMLSSTAWLLAQIACGIAPESRKAFEVERGEVNAG